MCYVIRGQNCYQKTANFKPQRGAIDTAHGEAMGIAEKNKARSLKINSLIGIPDERLQAQNIIFLF